jgi:2-methylcitrate dehydratase PrpD
MLTRRSLLRAGAQAGAAVAAARATGGPSWLQAQEGALRPGQTNADLPIGELMTRLSAYMSEARTRALPDDVVERAKRHVLDTIAAMVSGADLAPGRAALAFAQSYRGTPAATIVADSVTCGPIEAAMVNGTLAHADETDDTLAPGPWHPGCNVVPAALAVGETSGVDGAGFLRAVVLGYDVGTRLLAAIQPGLATGLKLSYGIGGVFGAAAAAGSILKFDARQMRWVLSYSAQQASGLESFPRDPDHIEKGFIFGGMPARSGVTAALLVKSGWTAVHDVLSGEEGFLHAQAPTGKHELLVDALGERYELMRANIKKWTVGQPIHAPLDAIEALLRRQPIDAAQIEQIVLRYPPGSITDNSGPSDINVQHAVAVMLIDKTVTFRSIHDAARMQDPTIVRLRSRTRLDPGPAGASAATRPPLVQITMTNGTRLTQDNTGAVLGTAANPMSRAQVASKARDLVEPVLGTSQTARLIERVLSLDTARDLSSLRPLLQRRRAPATPTLSTYPSRP